ncbi:hypothetical protein ACFX2F_015063 [Malus domestica]
MAADRSKCIERIEIDVPGSPSSTHLSFPKRARVEVAATQAQLCSNLRLHLQESSAVRLTCYANLSRTQAKPMAAAIHCSSALHSLKPPQLPAQLSSLRPSLLSANKHPNRRKNNNLSGYRLCRAEFSNDAPFAAAIGACMLSSLVLPVSTPDDDDSGGSLMDSTDARFAVMGIVSFIPYFNWLSWIFAWLDTGKRRYAVYALVYLAPYLRTNLSLSPEESWLPVASIVFCIIHVQLEASIKNGDLQGFQFFNEAAKHLSSTARRKDRQSGYQGTSEEGTKKENKNLPSSEEQSRNGIDDWGAPKRPLQDRERANVDWEENERRKH